MNPQPIKHRAREYGVIFTVFTAFLLVGFVVANVLLGAVLWVAEKLERKP